MSHLHRIAWAGSESLVTDRLAGRSLIVLAGSSDRVSLFRSPLAFLEKPGSIRLGGVAVAWVPADAALAAAAGMPDPVAVIVSSEPPPAPLPARVVWAQVGDGVVGEVQILSSHDSIEVRVIDYGA